MRESTRRMRNMALWLVAGLFIAGSAGAAIVETYMHGDLSTTNGTFTISGIDLDDDVNLLVVAVYADNYAVFENWSFGGQAPTGVIQANGTGNRNGQFYWINPNTDSNQTFVVDQQFDTLRACYQLNCSVSAVSIRM